MIKKRRSIALLVETSNAYSRGLLEGILAYAQQERNWSVLLPEQERGATPPSWLSTWQGDGIIARIETEEIARKLRRKRIPIVDLSAARKLPGIPWAETDDDAIAKLAVEHFAERGYMQMAYCGDQGFEWSIRRSQSFELHARQRGRTSHLFQSIHRYDANYSVELDKRMIANWVQKLPRPIAIMACYDVQARKLLDVCHELSISVPEEIAILGVDNDELLCAFADPPLSSIQPNTRQTGYQAAMLLDRMISGDKHPSDRLLTTPIGVKLRQSTGVSAIDDPVIATAMRYIREHSHHNIRIADVLKQVSMSRRVFESRFQKIIGRSPHQMIQRLRIERVQQLLEQPELSIADVARLAGYEHPEYMAAAFKRETGQTPTEARSHAVALR